MTETPAPRRTVSLLVAGLGGAVLLLVGGIAGYAIGDPGGPDRPGHSRYDRPPPHPPVPPDAQPRGQRPNSPPVQTPTPASTT
ncbi:hypothetical protein JOD54_005433 [Actinokineospora baliensis]|uniref:hypothetical protein n=1 Tax=Actinokineospora baliensis TaxID=547056 RepID=UPI001956D8B6|nr:hypothetical protein [Actinokineospora baliensis]MBM7775229.1 hypothetical protein [Actinokineospora baliensis]